MRWLTSWESFVRVVETGSMAAAARRLECSRALVSKQVAELERTFGTRLFERSTRRQILTPAGEVFYQHARRALQSVELADQSVRHLGDEPSGLLRVSASLFFGRMWVAPLLDRLTARHPKLDCELILNNELVDLAGERIDLALRFCNAPPEDVVAKRIFTISTLICASPDYLQRAGIPQIPADLAGHRCFSYLLSDGGVWQLQGGDGDVQRVPIHNRVQYNNAGCILDATLAGYGLAIIPAYLCRDDLQAGRLVRVLDGYSPRIDFGRHLYACYLPSRVRLSKVQVVLDALQALPLQAGF